MNETDHTYLPDEIWQRVFEDQQVLERIRRELIRQERKLRNSDWLADLLPRPGNTNEVGHLPGLG
jgi:hypothetical protein